MPFADIDLIHRIIIVDGGGIPEKLPETIGDNFLFAQQVYKSAQQKIWSDKALRSFIKSKFQNPVLEAYDMLQPYSYKCDLARACVLYIFGGAYIDLGIRLIDTLDVPSDKGIMAFRDLDFMNASSWTTITPAIMWSQPRRDELRIAIQMIVENCRNKFYGSNPLYPTGPVLFGRAFATHMVAHGQSISADDQWIGTYLKHGIFVNPGDKSVAVSVKKIGGDLTHLGMTGTNNYNVFWHHKTVYGEDKVKR